MLQIYLNSDHPHKMSFLNELFQPPSPSHSDSILFLNDPFPSTYKPPSKAESIESLINETNQMDLTLQNDDSPTFLDQITDQPSAPHGITYPYHQVSVLAEEQGDNKVNKTI